LAHLRRAATSGGPAEDLALDTSFAFALAGDDVLYVASTGRSIRGVAKIGGKTRLIASSPSEGYTLVVGGGYVYWTTSNGVYRAPTKGGTAIRLGAGKAWSPLAADGEYLYVASDKLERIRHGDARPTTLATGLRRPSDLVADTAFVYVTTGDDVKRIPRDGGTATTLATGGRAHDLVVTPEALYWTTWGDPNASANSCAGHQLGILRRIDPLTLIVEHVDSSCELRGVAATQRTSLVLIEFSRLVERQPTCAEAAFAARHVEAAYRIEGGEQVAQASQAAAALHPIVLAKCVGEVWNADALRCLSTGDGWRNPGACKVPLPRTLSGLAPTMSSFGQH
jgi:hypothetical protein